MNRIAVALGWAALLIGLPLLRHTGLVSSETIGGMEPVLTVLAAVQLSSLRPKLRCIKREAN